ncbi:DUF938 domain-containing protein [Novosphingobium sp. M1R2S20]|uniref:DUF938 domain-containing protein n=1 Tax=Novosphingobium rhizovicinum TaxID=3228928 RepID=A0ABV3R8R9_9SPHN
MHDARRQAPAVARNRDAILRVLHDVLPPKGLVLEIASGTGEHAVHFARALPELTWQPTDPSPEARESISAWRAEAQLDNLSEPLELDAASAEWPLDRADAILCINMIHISPWEATIGLMAGAQQLLSPGAPLVLYGPYLRSDRPLEPSNAAFDADLKARDPRWGLRKLDEVTDMAKAHGLSRDGVVEMPANNLTVIFRRC